MRAGWRINVFEAVVAAVGEDRVDWYVALGKVLGARIGREAEEKVLLRNMMRLLGPPFGGG